MSQLNTTNQDSDHSYEEMIQTLVAANADAVVESPRGEVGLELILRKAAAEAEKQRANVVESIRTALQTALDEPTTWSEIREMSDAEPPVELVEKYLKTESTKAKHQLFLQLIFAGCEKWAIRLMEINLERNADTDPVNATKLQSKLDQWRGQIGLK